MGVASSIGGWVVIKEPSGQLIHYHWLGWIAVGAALVSVWLASRVQSKETGHTAFEYREKQEYSTVSGS
jgi:DHA1 family inner membrane transport protein